MLDVLWVDFGTVVIVIVVETSYDGDGRVRSREVRNETKPSNSKLGLGTVELSDDIRRPYGLPNDDHGANITRLSLMVQRLFDARVANEDESPRLKVEIDNLRRVTLLEQLQALATSFSDGIAHGLDILGTLRKLLSAKSDKIFG